jgi:hypothetical protein
MKVKIFLALIILFVSACSTTIPGLVTSPKAPEIQAKKLEASREIKIPIWVSAGSGVFQMDGDESSGAFLGVGKEQRVGATGEILNPSGDNARNGLAAILDEFNQRLIRYHRSAKIPNHSGRISHEKLQNAVDETAVPMLLETKVVNNWEHPVSKEKFSLAKLDLSKIKEVLTASSKLNHEERQSLEFIIKWVFDDMKLEEERGQLFSKVSRAMAQD